MLDAARANAKMASTGAGAQRGERPRTGIGCHDDHK